MKPELLVLIPSIFLNAAAVFSQPHEDKPPSQLTQANNAFAFDLYGQLRLEAGNLFFSPASISTAFALAFAGAQGETARQMATTLHFTLPQDQLHPAMGALLAGLNAAHPGYQLHVADGLWAQKDERFLADFLRITSADYQAGFHPADFKTQPDAERASINEWVEEQTANRIKDLLPPGSVRADTRLVLANAIYFKGDWETPFQKSATQSEGFHLSVAQTVKAPLMHRTGSFNYFDSPGFQILEIPYKSDELSMIVILPSEADGLAALEKSLTASGAQNWLYQLQLQPKVILTLPRFTMTRQLELSGALSALGMRQAFGNSADFSAMNGKRDLFISAAIHKAFVDVNEEGTEAAAATGVVVGAMAVHREPPPIVFRADHPFLFLIRDNRSGVILFMGRVTDPTK